MNEARKSHRTAEAFAHEFFRNPRANIFAGGQRAEISMQQAAGRINEQDSNVRREFTMIMLNMLGGHRQDARLHAVLSVLQRVQLDDIRHADAARILTSYENAVRGQTTESNPHYLIEAGKYLHGKIIAKYSDPEMPISELIAQAWDTPLGNNFDTNEWAGTPERVFELYRTAQRQEAERTRRSASERVSSVSATPHEQIVDVFLHNRVGELAVSDNVVWTGVRAEAYQSIHKLDQEQTTQLATRLIEGMSADENGESEWNIDQLDGAVELFSLIDFRKVDTERFATSFADALNSQPADADPFGPVDALGKVAASMPEEVLVFDTVQDARNTAHDKFASHPDRGLIADALAPLYSEVPELDATAIEDIEVDMDVLPDYTEAIQRIRRDVNNIIVLKTGRKSQEMEPLELYLRAFRQKHGLSQSDLAKIAGLYEETYRHIENGDVISPTKANAKRIIQAVQTLAEPGSDEAIVIEAYLKEIANGDVGDETRRKRDELRDKMPFYGVVVSGKEGEVLDLRSDEQKWYQTFSSDDVSITDTVRLIRLIENLPRIDFAKRSGVPRETIADNEYGRRTPELRTLNRYIEASPFDADGPVAQYLRLFVSDEPVLTPEEFSQLSRGKKINYIRITKGLTLGELGEKLGGDVPIPVWTIKKLISDEPTDDSFLENIGTTWLAAPNDAPLIEAINETEATRHVDFRASLLRGSLLLKDENANVVLPPGLERAAPEWYESRMAVGEVIRRLREEKRISQKELVEKLHGSSVVQPDISRAETGKRRLNDFKAMAIIKGLGYRLHDKFARDMLHKVKEEFEKVMLPGSGRLINTREPAGRVTFARSLLLSMDPEGASWTSSGDEQALGALLELKYDDFGAVHIWQVHGSITEAIERRAIMQDDDIGRQLGELDTRLLSQALTPDEVYILNAYETKTAPQIAEELGYDTPERVYTAIHTIRRKGIPVQQKKTGHGYKASVVERQDLVAMLFASQIYTAEEIAEISGNRSVGAVYRDLYRYEQRTGTKVERLDRRSHPIRKVQATPAPGESFEAQEEDSDTSEAGAWTVGSHRSQRRESGRPAGVSMAGNGGDVHEVYHKDNQGEDAHDTNSNGRE